MTRQRLIKTTFTAGELSPDLYGRGDIRSYDNGAGKLRNVFIHPTGGVVRRAGLRYIDTAAGNGRLMSFEFNSDQTYLIVLTHLRIDIYAEGALQTTLSSPWTEAQATQVTWTQSADTLLMTHPDVSPKKLTRGSGGVWSLSDWIFYTKDNIVYQPYYKFADVGVTLTPSGTSGTVTLTASASVFEAGHVNTRLRFATKEVLITTVNSGTVVIKTIGEAALLSVEVAKTALCAFQSAPFEFKPEFSNHLSRMLALFSSPEAIANNQYPTATKVAQDIEFCNVAPGIVAALPLSLSLPTVKI